MNTPAAPLPSPVDVSLASASSPPTWDLRDLYDGKEDPKIPQDLDAAEQGADSFRAQYEGHVKTLSGDELAKAIKTFEEQAEVLGKLSSYGSLLFASDMTHKGVSSFYQDVKERVNAISQKGIFFSLEINLLPDDHLEGLLKDSEALRSYSSWLRDIRLFKKHQLSHDLEKILHEKHICSMDNWIRLYDEVLARLRFDVGGKQIPINDLLPRLMDANPEVRKEAGLALAKGLAEQEEVFSLILNTLAKDLEITTRWRRFASPLSARNLENSVEDDVVSSLIQSVKEAYPSISHRFYKLKAKWLGVEKLNFWDRNAPLPQDKRQSVSWEQAQSIVLESYRGFSPRMAALGQEFFDKNWIDAALRPGKDSGAFSHPVVPSAHPYILQNYQGNAWDVMTLAHELGHGIHQRLAARQGYLMMDTPLTIAETASIFGEMLTFRSLMAKAQTKEERKVLLAGKVNDALNTIVRQVAFSDFETRLHSRRLQKELTAKEIGEIWMEVQKESLGDTFVLDPAYHSLWAYISHFYHVPFYVYAYAFGNCLVNSLYAAYEKGLPDFEEKYLALLEAGGTLHHKELLAPFGLDASNPDFWRQGLGLIATWIDELEALD